MTYFHKVEQSLTGKGQNSSAAQSEMWLIPLLFGEISATEIDVAALTLLLHFLCALKLTLACKYEPNTVAKGSVDYPLQIFIALGFE